MTGFNAVILLDVQLKSEPMVVKSVLFGIRLFAYAYRTPNDMSIQMSATTLTVFLLR